MLPAESLADVVCFLGYYDLGGLKMTNKRLSDIATQSADAIRVFDFSDFRFYVGSSWIDVYREESTHRTHHVRLDLTNEQSLTEFIYEAFRNCTVGPIYVHGLCEHALNALEAVANTIIVAGTLDVSFGFLGNVLSVQKLLEYVDSFRRVKRLHARKVGGMTSDERKSIEQFCRRKNIEHNFLL